MKIYAKRKIKNVIKQKVKQGLCVILIIIGILSCLNWFIDYIGHINWFIPKTTVIKNPGYIGSVVEVKTETAELVPIEKLSVVTNDNSEGEIGKTEISLPPSHIESLVRKTFREDEETAVAVLKAESHLNPNAINYNCRYDGKSTSCRKGDEEMAWSTDCGLSQINVQGKGCPTELMNPENNLVVAYGKYQRNNWNPWVAFTNGSYKKYLNN